jgi:predicted nucleotidyltransferase
MKTAAIIAEYNPFHLGHAWQLQAVRQQFGADCAVLAVMSGCFTQRGDPAMLDKWSRARIALACGVDLVIELPFAYATASAERFAAGGVRLVQATGLDCQLVFGSESGDLAQLQRLAGLLADEPPGFRELLHQQLAEGASFPAARQQALADWTGEPELAALLESSNNILAVEYLKALSYLENCRLTPVTFRRQGQDYQDSARPGAADGFASAAAIRRRLDESRRAGPAGLGGLVCDLAGMMPSPALAILLEKLQSGPGPVRPEDLAGSILGLLRSLTPDRIEETPGMAEGLGRRLAAAARRPGEMAADDRLAALLADAATRRFPRTRIQRALLALLAGVKNDDFARFDAAGGPQYLRILGFNKQGRHLLKIMRHEARVPILMNASDALECREPALIRMAELDSLATDLWMLAAGGTCGRDFDTPAVMR